MRKKNGPPQFTTARSDIQRDYFAEPLERRILLAAAPYIHHIVSASITKTRPHAVGQTVSSGSINATPNITIDDDPPTVQTAAAANPNPVTGTSTVLSVQGADDDNDPSELSYTWSYTGPTGVTYTGATNGTNAANDITANFTQAGSYTFTATIVDSDGLFTTSQTAVTVNQTPTGVVVSPTSTIATPGGTAQFSATAIDQFGNAIISPAFNWSITGTANGNSINSSGLATLGLTQGNYTVTASLGSVSNTAQVIVSLAPAVNAFQINDGNVQRSMVNSLTVTFNQPVVFSAGAIALNLVQVGGVTTPVSFRMHTPDGGTTWVLTFTQAGYGGGATAMYGGSLPNGAYQLVVNGDLVNNAAGQTMSGTTTENFWRLYGDFTGQGTVNAGDFGILAPLVGQPVPQQYWYVDYNGDGKIDATDFGAFAPDFGQTVQMPAVATTPIPVITVTSPSTVLPLESVNVQALASNFGNGNSLNSIIAWNFGDPGSAYNTLPGFSAAHAYAAPGTYTITLTITTPDGSVGTATTMITVSPDNRQTIYVSTSGSDSNNGLTPATAVQTLAEANSLMTSNTDMLLQAGDTFTFSNQNVLNAAGMQHVFIGSYGTGAQPILMYTGPAVQGADIGMSSTTQGLVVQGLTFDSIYTNNNDKKAIPSAFFPMGNDITIIDNTFLNVLNDMNMQGSPTNVLVQGNTSPNPTGLSAYFAWVQGAEIAFLGNTVADSAGEAIIRIGGASDILIANNNLTKQLDGGDKNVLSIQAGSYAYVYNNTLAIGPTSVGPLGVSSADPNVSFDYAVFDSNTVVDNNFLMQPGAENLMYRNNVIEAAGNTGFTINGQEISGSFNWQVQNVWIENNTVTDSGMWGGFLTINNGEAQNVNILNNLFVDPTFETGFGEGFIVDNNGDMNSFSQIANNVWSVPVAVSHFAQGGYFFVGSNPGNPSAWLTPAEWEATGVPTGDVYENINLGATYSVEVDGFTAGSSLPTL